MGTIMNIISRLDTIDSIINISTNLPTTNPIEKINSINTRLKSIEEQLGISESVVPQHDVSQHDVSQPAVLPIVSEEDLQLSRQGYNSDSITLEYYAKVLFQILLSDEVQFIMRNTFKDRLETIDSKIPQTREILNTIYKVYHSDEYRHRSSYKYELKDIRYKLHVSINPPVFDSKPTYKYNDRDEIYTYLSSIKSNKYYILINDVYTLQSFFVGKNTHDPHFPYANNYIQIDFEHNGKKYVYYKLIDR